jgi:hypothetical protein
LALTLWKVPTTPRFTGDQDGADDVAPLGVFSGAKEKFQLQSVKGRELVGADQVRDLVLACP